MNYPYAFKLTYSPAVVAYCSGITTLHTPTGTITDGSGNNDYNNNSDCRWKIQPSGANNITLNFTSFDIIDPYDTVYVYDGGTTASPLLAASTGNTVPDPITSTGGIMLVRFSTDASNTAPGWTANYTSTVVPTNCSGTTTMLSAATGTFSDASGSGNYSNNTNCSWLISPPGAFEITLNFSSFHTEPINDIVNVYDGNDNQAPLLGSFSGTTIPPTLTSSGGAMFIEFISNGTITDEGWVASYTSLIPSSINGIVKYEYWFDNNFASRIGISVSAQSIYHLNTSIPSAGLSIGLHSLHIRFIDNHGQWSSIVSQFFYKQPPLPTGGGQIIAYEYWFDNDYSSKVSQTVAPTAIHQLISGLPANSLSQGLHSFHLRYKDNTGKWSSVVSQFFYKQPISTSGDRNITGYEYWFDNGFGAKVSQTVSPQQTYILNTALSAESLSLGLHNFHIRYKDDAGQWSSVVSSVIFKIGVSTSPANLISGYRYWFDMASSSMVNQTLPTPVNPYQLVQNVYVGNLPLGDHSIHFQFRDIAGQWSSVISADFTFAGPLEKTTITSQTISNGQANCYDALQTITVAGNGATFIIQTGGSSNMIAGQNIIYFPNTTVETGGYMHGIISPSGPFCLTPSLPTSLKVTEDLQPVLVSEKSTIKVYPNPTTGNFTVELRGDIPAGNVTINVFGLRGEQVLTSEFNGERKHEFTLSTRPVGVYFIRVITEGKSETVKIIKN